MRKPQQSRLSFWNTDARVLDDNPHNIYLLLSGRPVVEFISQALSGTGGVGTRALGCSVYCSGYRMDLVTMSVYVNFRGVESNAEP